MAYERECENLIHWRVYGEIPLSEIVFFVTNRCNQRCLTCWQWEEDFTTTSKELSNDKWISLLYEALELGVHHLYIVGGGEPMVKGDLVLALGEIAKKHGLFCVLHTNGTLLKKEQMDKFISLQWDQIIISLDGPSSDVNDLIRGEGTFDKAYKSLIYLRDHRIIKNEPIPDLGINFTITNVNYRYIPEMVELARTTGCGGIHATLVLPLSENSKRFVLTEEELYDCLNFLKKGIELCRNYGLYSTFESVVEEIESKLTLHELEPKNKRTSKGESILDSYCLEPLLSLTISSDGRVSPCCMLWTEHNPSVLNSSLKEIWYGEFMKDLRNTLIRGNYPNLPTICQNCPSQLRKRTMGIKEALLEREKDKSRRVGALIRKFWIRFKKEGLSDALNRTWEYIYTLFRGI